MEQIPLAYGLPKETVTTIMILYKNTKVKVCSLNGDSLLWHCCLCSARGYISPISIHNLPRLHTSNVHRSNERKWFYTKWQEADDTPQKTITDTDVADDIALLTNTPTLAKSLLHSLEQAAGGIDLHVNTDKTEYMCFN